MCLHHDCGRCPQDPRTSRRAQEEAVGKEHLHNRHQITQIRGHLATYSVQKQLADVLVANLFNMNIWATEDGQDRVFQMGAEGSVNDRRYAI